MKTILKDSYNSQIKSSEAQKNEEKRRKIMEERDYLSQFEGQSRLETNQRRKVKEDYKRELF